MNNNEELNNSELVTLAVYLLGGSTNFVDVEDIAIEVFSLAPNKFSWKKHKDQIDIKIVQYSLHSACKKNLGYLQGSARHGYILTKTGLQWVQKIDDDARLTTKSRKSSSADLLEKEKARLERTQANLKFINGDFEKINIIDFREFTRVNDYFPKFVRDERYAKIENAVAGNEKLKMVWDFLKNKFMES